MLTLIKNSIEYSLDNGVYGYFIGDEGWGMIPLHRLSEHGPQQDGETDRGYRAEARIGKLLFDLVGSSRYNLFYRREQLMSLFTPKANLQLKWAIDDWSRQFDVVFAGDMDFPSGDRKGFSQSVVVSLKANDPTCYNPDRQLLEYSGGGGTGFAVPIPVPLKFGMSSFNITQSINQLGNADDYPEITIVGPITDCVISNLSYNEKLDFTGTTIGNGVTYVIDLRYGHKTVIELPNTNQLDKLSQDSDLATWCLRSGYNDVKVVGTNITSASKVQIKYYYRYLGV